MLCCIFLFEKIHFRHVLDWAMFLRVEVSQVDWDGSGSGVRV